NAAMEEEVTALTTSLERCHFKKDAEEGVPKGMFKVTDDMTFEYLVGRGLEPWRAKLLLEQARLDKRIAFEQAKLDEREALIKEREASLNEKIVFLQKKEADGQDKTNNEDPLYSSG
ncbi:dynein heavy chain 5, axonemal-like protein, partial [Corchorus olitorius]